VRQFDSVGYSLRHLCREMHPLAKPRLGFPDDPSAQRSQGIAPKNIAPFNTHTEALEPMAGATFARYDASFPAQMGGGDEEALPSRRQAS
jgi:hypothetical protein